MLLSRPSPAQQHRHSCALHATLTAGPRAPLPAFPGCYEPERLTTSGTSQLLGQLSRNKARHPVLCQANAVMELPAVDIPQSQEQAVGDACQDLARQLQPLLVAAKKNQGFSKGSSANSTTQFAIEIPVRDTQPATTIALVSSMFGKLSQQLKNFSSSQCTVVFADAATASATKGKLAAGKILELQEACRQAQLSGVLVVVGPTTQDVALFDQLVDEVWQGPALIVLNPEWSLTSVPQEYQQRIQGLSVVYCFQPIEIKGLLGGKQGAIYRRMLADPTASEWKILYTYGDKFVQVGKMKQRPTQNDLELAFMNATAATSPLTQAVKTLKGFADLVGGKKK